MIQIRLFFSPFEWIIALVCLTFTSCNKFPGYEKIEKDFYVKLNQFGDCRPMLKDAAYSVLEIKAQRADSTDAIFNSIVYLGKLRKTEISGEKPSSVSDRLITRMELLNCGDNVTWILPFGDFDSTYLSGYGRYQTENREALVKLNINVIHTFDRQGFVNFLMQAAQQGELQETEAINMFFVDGNEHPVEQHGDVFIEKWNDADGDTIRAGMEVTMNYSTFLLNGTSLDPLTTMTFQFGRPGQLVPGFQYGLSFLREGERARIYMPSYLAFGEDGSSTGIVPRNTPVYFDVSVILVRNL
ncbi:MAG: FKBP-type peptidyl-prolyl cis-trans isomerase [Crocinitomicaceae bacterium]|nr:FKBP-type peptidyl-prolyl cis-trans isomerase [Crocinitomicaceae bacterium]